MGDQPEEDIHALSSKGLDRPIEFHLCQYDDLSYVV